jgi:serine phosphatase RsbU (regulator of sigma subunit)/Tfp pilus assembly protein PilF
LKSFTYILLFLISFQGIAQNFGDKEFYLVDSLVLEKVSGTDKHLIDSCLKVYYKANDDTNRVKAINSIVEKCWDANVWPKYNEWVSSFIERKLKTQLSIPISEFYKRALAVALNNTGYFYNHNKGQALKALEYYHKSLKLKEELGEQEGVANSLNNIGAIYRVQGDIPKALEYYHKSLKIQEEIGSKRGIASSLVNIGYVYNHQGESTKAIEYYHKSLKIQEELGDKRGLAYSLNNIGTIYETQNDKPKALEYFNEALLLQEELGDDMGIAYSLGNIGGVYQKQGDYDKAIKYYNKSLKIQTESGDKDGVAASLRNIGYIKLAMGNISEAQDYTERSLLLAKEIGYPENIKRTAFLLSKIYANQNKGMKALEMHKLYLTMRDSINNEATQKATVKQQAKYKYEKQKTIDDKEHEKQLAISAEQEKKQRVIIYAVIGGLILVILFSIIIYNRLQITRKQKLIIEDQKVEVEIAHYQLEEKNTEILDSITYAKRIQDAILPADELVKELLPNSFILYKPKDIVAGDFYWMEQQGDHVLFAAADCTGHGVPGAMVSVVCHNAMNRVVKEFRLTKPGEILDKTRELIINQLNKAENSEPISMNNIRDGMDIALCVLNTKTNQLHYAGAHNPLWILRNGDEEIEETKADKQPIGKVDNPQDYETHQVQLNEGDSIYIFSDGFADQFGGEKGKKLKYKPFKQLLVSLKDETMENQLEILESKFETWKGNLEQVDDVCIIGVKI